MIHGTYEGTVNSKGQVVLPIPLKRRLDAGAEHRGLRGDWIWASLDDHGVRLSALPHTVMAWEVRLIQIREPYPSVKFTIPQPLRKAYDLLPGAHVRFVETQTRVLLLHQSYWDRYQHHLERDGMERVAAVVEELHGAARAAADLLQRRGLHATAEGVHLRRTLARYEEILR